MDAQHAANGRNMARVVVCDPITGDAVNPYAAASGIVVTGGDRVGNVRTAAFLNATGTLQWARVHAVTGALTDIPGATALSYTLVSGDIGFIVKPYATTFFPLGNSNAIVTA